VPYGGVPFEATFRLSHPDTCVCNLYSILLHCLFCRKHKTLHFLVLDDSVNLMLQLLYRYCQLNFARESPIYNTSPRVVVDDGKGWVPTRGMK
jgi:hypothetical protein